MGSGPPPPSSPKRERLSAELGGRGYAAAPVNPGFLSKRNIAIILGAALVLTVVIVGVAVGVGHPSVPSDDVAVIDDDSINVPGLVEDGKVTKSGFDRLLNQTALQQGLQGPPQPSDPQYKAVQDQALGTALDAAWIEGEADRQGASVTDTQVQQQFEATKSQNFKTEEEYQKFLQTSGLSQEEVNQRVRLQLISKEIEDKLTNSVGNPSDGEAQEFYEANKSQFSQPEQRTIRLIQNKDAAQVDQAYQALKADDSPQNWNTVAKQFSTDPQSKEKGGLRTGIVKGTFEQPLDDDVFNASQGQVEGPVSTPTGSFVYEVESIQAGTTQDFDQVKDQIKQQIKSTEQQEAFSAFLTDYRDYWSSRTVCGDDYLIVRCDNFEGSPSPCPDPSLTPAQQQQQLQQQGCPPPALTISPVAPGTVRPFVPAVGGQPQRPHPPGEGTAPTSPGTLPQGIVPGAGGATGAGG
jgi:parvulin-like peptidyl-prolyl isomerase